MKYLMLFIFTGLWFSSIAQQNVLNATGNVGVGTTNPEERLHIEGNTIMGQNSNLWLLHPQSSPATSFIIAPKINNSWDFNKSTIFKNTGDVLFNNNITVNGKLNFGLSNSRTENRDDASLQGSQGAVSGFFQTLNPQNFPTGASSWWHLLDVRHSNIGNNFAMQFAGSFFDQKVYLRKVNNNPTQSWEQILTDKNTNGLFVKYANGNVGIGIENPQSRLEVNNSVHFYTPSPTAGTWYKNVGLGLFIDTFYNLWEIKTNDNSGHGFMNFHNNRWGGNISLTRQSPGGTKKSLELISSEGHPNVLAQYNESGVSITNQISSNGITFFNGGNVGIGTLDPGNYKLAVNGHVKAKEVKVSTQNWSDFVFTKNYKLPSLKEVEKYIADNKHLPEIPSEKEVLANGIDLGEMNAKLLQKIEELTLYIIQEKKDREKEIKELREAIEKLAEANKQNK